MILTNEVLSLLSEANFAQLATVNADGSPHVDTVWFEFSHGQLLIASTGRTKKSRNLDCNPAAFAVITHRDNPYEQAQLTLQLLGIEDDSSMAVCDRIARKYTGKDFVQRQHPQRVAISLKIRKVKYHKARVA